VGGRLSRDLLAARTCARVRSIHHLVCQMKLIKFGLITAVKPTEGEFSGAGI
jgi:hypothetical protein